MIILGCGPWFKTHRAQDFAVLAPAQLDVQEFVNNSSIHGILSVILSMVVVEKKREIKKKR
jgi:hypothetical protein